MKAIDFVVRAGAGDVQRGTVPGDAQNQTIVVGADQEISINARQTDFRSQVRSGDQLIITLSDGRTITIDNFFNESGEPNRLFISAEGYLNEVTYASAGDGALAPQYGPTSEWGKWSISDELIFLGDPQVAGVPLNTDGEEVSMLGAGLLGGAGLMGTGGAAAAALGGAAILGGVGGGNGDGPTDPFVNDADVFIGGDGADDRLVISGGGEPGDGVLVTIGDRDIETEIGKDGTFEAVFEGEDFPDDGEYESGVTVTDPDGNSTDLDGPDFTIDTTAPEIVVTSGTDSVGDYFNASSFDAGVTISGTGEPGARVDVTIGQVTQTTVVDASSGWSVSWPAETLEAGDYTADVSIVTTDSFGNSRSYSDVLVVDTVNTVTIDSTTIAGDGTVNGAEHAAGVSFNGSAQAGSTVEVTVGSVTHVVTATSEGTWSATFTASEIVTGEYEGLVSVLSTDVHQNTATASGSFDVDTFVRDLAITSSTGGEDGVINAQEAEQPLVVAGTTEPGSTVVVDLDGTRVDATVSASGSWSATFAAGSIAVGTYTATMTATATDAAGNTESASTGVRIDTDAGVLTIDPDPIATDDIINRSEASDGVVLTGTADADADVVVTMNGVSTQVTATADGTWEAFFAASDIAPGVYTADITATTTDAYGNSRSATDSVEVDTRVDDLLLGDNITGDNIVSGEEQSDGFTVTGTTEVGSTSVEVTVGRQTVSADVDSAGNWTADFGSDALVDGTYTADITVLATDRAGNQKTVSGTVDVDTEVVPFDMTSNSAGTDQVVNAEEAGAGIDLGGSVEAGSAVTVTFDGKSQDAVVDAAGNWALTVPASDVRPGTYAAKIVVQATDPVGNVATIEDTLAIDTDAPDGPVIASFTRDGDGIRGISIETVMEDGVPTEDVQSIVQVASDGSISDVAGAQGFNAFRSETEFAFDENVSNGAQLIVNATDAAGNTSGTFLVLDDEVANSTVDLSHLALGDYQIENLDLDFAEAAQVVIDEASLLALSTESNTLTVHGSGDDQVQIVNGRLTGTQDVDGQSFNVYAVGAEATLLIDPEIPVTI